MSVEGKPIDSLATPCLVCNRRLILLERLAESLIWRAVCPSCGHVIEVNAAPAGNREEAGG